MSSKVVGGKKRVGGLRALAAEIVACAQCPRLTQYLGEVARTKKREFADWDYWGRPLAGFGDPSARLLIVGLAPAAHGGARTGRMFTGDSSGLWLARAMHRAGFASVPWSRDREDGLELRGAWITNACRCAPPANKPEPAELASCRPYLVRELSLLGDVRVIVALGKIAWEAALRTALESGAPVPVRPRPKFTHGAELDLGRWRLLGSYHPSRQNTNTGVLTEPMLDAIFTRAQTLAR